MTPVLLTLRIALLALISVLPLIAVPSAIAEPCPDVDIAFARFYFRFCHRALLAVVQMSSVVVALEAFQLELVFNILLALNVRLVLGRILALVVYFV